MRPKVFELSVAALARCRCRNGCQSDWDSTWVRLGWPRQDRPLVPVTYSTWPVPLPRPPHPAQHQYPVKIRHRLGSRWRHHCAAIGGSKTRRAEPLSGGLPCPTEARSGLKKKKKKKTLLHTGGDWRVTLSDWNLVLPDTTLIPIRRTGSSFLCGHHNVNSLSLSISGKDYRGLRWSWGHILRMKNGLEKKKWIKVEVEGSCSITWLVFWLEPWNQLDQIVAAVVWWSGVSGCSSLPAQKMGTQVWGCLEGFSWRWWFDCLPQMNSIHLLIRDSKKYLWKIHFHSSSPECPWLHLFLKPIRWQRTLQPLAYITCGAGVSSRMCRHHYVPVPYMLFNGFRGRPITLVGPVAGILGSVDAKHRSRTFTSWTIFLKVNVGKDCVTSQKCWSRSSREHLLRPS